MSGPSDENQIYFCGESSPDSGGSVEEWYRIEVPVREAHLSEQTVSSIEKLNPFSVDKQLPSLYYAALDDQIFSLGGQNQSEDGDVTLSNNVRILDRTCPDEGWKAGTPMKNARFNPHTIVVDGKLYVLGGFEPNQNQADGWIEVFDPEVGEWKSLPSPPDQIHSSVMISGLLKVRKEIIIAKQRWKSRPIFYSYNIRTGRWDSLSEGRPSVHPVIEKAVSDHPNIGRAVTVGNTLYWISTNEEHHDDCIIRAYDLDKNMWFEDTLRTAKIFGDREHSCSNNSAGPGFLHLRDQKFCLLLQSAITKHNPPSSIEYLYCVILEISPISDHNHEYKGKHKLTTLSVEKYSMDHYIGFLDCMLLPRVQTKQVQ